MLVCVCSCMRGGGDVCSHGDEGSRHLVALVNAFSEAVDTRERERERERETLLHSR